MKNKLTLWNVLTNFLLQIFLIANGFIIPKLILSYFGSEVNGLVSSINQFLSYITLIEGGVTGVIMASLYKPLVDKDEKKISSIINTSKLFYKKVGYIFIIYSLLIAIIYPLLFNKSFSFLYVMSLVLILSINLIIQYMFSLSLRTLLAADKKLYIISITQIITIIVTILLSIISVIVYPQIHILKLVSGVLFLIQPIVYNKYTNKHYNLDKKAKVDNNLLRNRWNGFAVNIAYFIHSSTDITLLTFFSSLELVSVYSVYALVTNGIKSIINAICTGINPTIGQAYAKNDQSDLIIKFNTYEYLTFILVYFIFGLALLLITPFVLIYTNGVTDVSYNQPLFGTLLIIAESIYLLKNPHVNLAYSANKFKEITIPSFVEAALNIIISLILVGKYGLIGIAVGSIVGMLYRTIFHVHFTKQLINQYNPLEFYKKIIIFSIALFICIFLCKGIIPVINNSIISWIISGLVYSIVFFIFYLIISLVFYRKEFKILRKYIIK